MAEKIDRKSLLRQGLANEKAAVDRRFKAADESKWDKAEAALSARPSGLAAPAPEAPDSAAKPAGEGGSFKAPLDRVHDNPWNARRVYEPERVAALAASIEAKGQIYPAPAVPHPELEGHWILVDGHYRRRACEMAGLGHVLVAERPAMPPREMFRLSYALNEERSSQTALDNALSWSDLIAKKVYQSAEELAGSVGLSPGKVAKVLALLKLPEEALEVVRENPTAFGPAVAYELCLCAKALEPKALAEFARRAASEGLSSREIARERAKLEAKSTRRPKEISRQYKIRAQGQVVGAIREWDSGRVSLEVVLADSAEREALVESLRGRFALEPHAAES